MKQRTYLHFFNSPSKTALENLFYIESTGHYYCDKSFYEDSYYKQNYYLIYVISGKGFYQDNEGQLPVSAGQLLYIDLSRPYKYYSNKKEPWEFLWVLFGGRNSDWYHQIITGKNKALFDLQASSGIPEFLSRIYKIHEEKDPFLEMKDSRIITDMLTELYIESMLEIKIKREQEFIYPDLVNTIISFIERNYFRKITLDELSSITFLSPYYLLRQFKKYTGYTPGEYINKHRIDFSKQLLLEPELTIEQIALNVGFYSHSYFCRMFKKSTSLTPEQFRRNYSR